VAQHGQDSLGIFGVEIAGGLIGEHDFRLIDDGAGDGHALLLSAGKLGWAMAQAASEAEQLRDDLKTVRIEPIAVNVLRDGDIAAGVKRGQKIEALKNESDFVTAQLGALGVAHQSEIIAIDEHFAARGARQTAKDVEQRGFAAARRSHDGHGFAREHPEIHPTKRGHFELARVVNFPKIFCDEYRFHALNL
jgi:hypothetical protein